MSMSLVSNDYTNDNDIDDCIVICMSTTVVNQRGLLFLFCSSECVRARACGGNGHLLNDITIISSSMARSSLLMASHEQQRKNGHKDGTKQQRKHAIIIVVFLYVCVCLNNRPCSPFILFPFH